MFPFPAAPDAAAYAAVRDAARRIRHVDGRGSERLLDVPSGGLATGGLALLDDGETIEKIIRKPRPAAANWLNEVRFCLDMAADLARPDMTIPPLRGIRLIDRETVALQIAFVGGTSGLQAETRAGAVRGFGRLAGLATEGRLHFARWLPESPGIRPSDHARALGTARALLEELGLPGHWRALERLLAAAPALCRRYRRAVATLCHGDASQHNVLVQSPGRFCVLDWGSVNSGRIGDDLARLMYPAVVARSEARSVRDVRETEERLLGHYLAGAREVLPRLDGGTVAAAFELKSALLAFGLARTFRQWLERAPDAAAREARRDRTRVFYDLAAARAARLAELG